MSPTVFKPYIFLYNGPSDLRGRVKHVVKSHYNRHGLVPLCLRVNPKQVEKIQEAVEDLGLRMPVIANAGTLAFEIEAGVE